MTDKMQALLKKQAAERERLALEQRIANLVFELVGQASLATVHGDYAHVGLKSETLAGAVELFQKFTVLPMIKAQGPSFTVVQPLSVMAQKYHDATDKSRPYACQIGTAQIDGSMFDAAAGLEFYATLADLTLSVTIRFGTDRADCCRKVNATKREERDMRKKLVKRWYLPNLTLQAWSDSYISWGTYEGPAKSSYDIDYLFTAEEDLAKPGVEFAHACSKLLEIAKELEV